MTNRNECQACGESKRYEPAADYCGSCGWTPGADRFLTVFDFSACQRAGRFPPRRRQGNCLSGAHGEFRRIVPAAETAP